MVHPFYILMPVWGELYVDYLLKAGLATMMSPGNIPALPNLKDSKFIFLTTEEDAERIKKTNLYSDLAKLLTVEWEFFNFFESVEPEKYDQLHQALIVGANKALGKGYCLFLHPDGVHSDGMMRRLYQLAEMGKKAVISIGPYVTAETAFQEMEESGFLRYDAPVEISPRQMAKIFENNIHPDILDHFWENKRFPEAPFVAIWKAPGGGGYLFRYVSLHPWLVDLKDRKDIKEFGTIDHGFVRAQGFLWSDIHVENDSDNFIVLALKRGNDRDVDPRPVVNFDKMATIGKMFLNSSNSSYNRFYFLNGIRVHTDDISEDWIDFEIQNLLEVNLFIEREIAYRQKTFLIKILDAIKALELNSYFISRKINGLISKVLPKPVRRRLRFLGRGLVDISPKFFREPLNRFLSKIHD